MEPHHVYNICQMGCETHSFIPNHQGFNYTYNGFVLQPAETSTICEKKYC